MSTIPIQNLVIDDSTDIGLSSDLINGTYKTSSLTDLSQNVYTKIFDLSSNLNTAISTKENILSFNGPMSKSSNTVSIDLSQYPLKTYVDGSLNTINTTLGTKQNNFTCITPLIKNDVSNNIRIDLSAYTTTGNDTNYLLKAGGTMTGNLIVNPAIPNIQLGGTNGHNLGVATAAGHFSASAIAGDMILRSRNKLILQSGATAAFIIDASNNVVIGTTTNALYKLSVDGAFNSTSLYNNGTLINFNAYATNTNLTTNYYNKTSTDSLLNTKQDTLLFTSPLLKDISNNVTIDLSAYPLKINVDASFNDLQITKQDNLLFTSPLLKDVSNNISVDLSAYPLKTEVNNNFYNKTEIDNIKIYLAERQYPPKAYNTSTLQESITYLNQNVFKETITLNTDGIIYGSGTYDIYSSTSYLSSLYLRKDLFNQNLNEVGGHYLQPNYTAPNGTYDKTSNYILNGYFGDWIIVKLPYQIILSRFRFYARPTFNSRSPGLWRCYGSNDGTTFTEITEASNTTTSIPSSTYNTYYEKTLSTFNTPYLYIGWTINKLVGSNSNADTLNFAELQIFGKELVTSTSFNNVIGTKQDNLIFTSPLLKDISNNVTINLSAYPLKTNVDSSLNSLNTNKQNVFTCISPLIKNDISNNISVDLSAYPLKTNVDSSLNSLNTNKQNVFTCISPLIKNDISNNISVDLSAYPLKTNVDSSLNTIDTTLGTKENILTFSAPLTRTTNTIGINLSSYSTTGNDPNYLLKTGGTMTGDLNITTATKVLNFGSRIEDYLIRLFGTDYGFGINGGVLRYNSAANHVFYCAGTERMRLTTDGNLSTTGYIYAGGTTNGLRINGNDYANTIYQAATTIGGQPANIGFTLRDANSFNFQSFSTAGAYTTIASLNTTNGLSLFGNIIYNYLFNNNAVNHEDTITDFNNVSKFGYQFVRGNTNGPGTVSTFNQYYQWFIGLGANYGVNSHGCQFALPRYTGQPELSVRFKENNVWTDWFGINSVGVRMPINTWGIGSKDGKSRMGNLNNGATLFRGYGTPTLADNAFEFRNTADSLILNISDSGNASLAGRFSARFLTISNTNRDLLGINFENTQVGNENNATIYCIQGTFTGFHRCFTEDELFDKNNPQVFKDNYEGRIVISTGKIATDTNDNNEEWIIKYDKDGITIEDALPQIELSRKKKDKRVFGVLGDKRRNNSRPERLIINSVGEGALWVINSNGNIENGDYITSSDYMGYGEKQDDDLLHNYTVAKSTMDCNFELDSNLYNCLELENGMRIAFIAVTYHCG